MSRKLKRIEDLEVFSMEVTEKIRYRVRGVNPDVPSKGEWQEFPKLKGAEQHGEWLLQMGWPEARIERITTRREYATEKVLGRS